MFRIWFAIGLALFMSLVTMLVGIHAGVRFTVLLYRIFVSGMVFLLVGYVFVFYVQRKIINVEDSGEEDKDVIERLIFNAVTGWQQLRGRSAPAPTVAADEAVGSDNEENTKITEDESVEAEQMELKNDSVQESSITENTSVTENESEAAPEQETKTEKQDSSEAFTPFTTDNFHHVAPPNQ